MKKSAFILGVFLFAACSDSEQVVSPDSEAYLENAEAKIQEIAARDFTEVTDTTGWKQDVEILQKGADHANNDSLWARYQLLSADLQAEVPGAALYAIRTYIHVADSLVGQDKGALALYCAAITFDTKLGDAPRAIQVLTRIMDEYPNSDYSREAEKYLNVLLFETEESLLEKIHQWENQE